MAKAKPLRGYALEVAEERAEKLKELQTDGVDLAARFGPESFGHHELVDRLHLISSLFEDAIMEHPSCIMDPWLFLAASYITDSIQLLYQDAVERQK